MKTRRAIAVDRRGSLGPRTARGRLVGRSRLAALFAATLTAALLSLPAAALAAPPTATLDSPGSVETTRVHLSGDVTVPPEGPEVWWGFEYAIQGTGQWSGFPFSGTVAADESQPVQTDLAGLSADTTYEVRLFVTDLSGTEVESAIETFTTDPAPVAPVATVSPAGDVSYTSAELAGAIDPEGGNKEASGAFAPIHWSLQVSPSGDPGSFAEVGSGGSADLTEEQRKSFDPLPVGPAEATNLLPGQTYLYRLLVTYAGQELAQTPASEGEFTTLLVAPPAVTIDPPSSRTPFGAHLSGTVEVTGTDPAFTASCRFELVSEAKFQTDEWAQADQLSCQPAEVHGSEPQPVTVGADPTLIPNTTYHLRLLATNAGGQGVAAAPDTFSTPALAPEIDSATLLEPTPTSIILAGRVNPHNSPLSDCHFAYGEGFDLDQSVPCESLPTGEGQTEVRAQLTGLNSGTDYSFQLSATNGAGTTEGEIRHFTTFAITGGEPCPNEAIRAVQRATHIADCRAWERVSPADKNNGDVLGEGFSTVAARSGDAAGFDSLTAFGDTVGSGTAGHSTYVSRRTNTGWSTRSVTPTGQPEAVQVLFASTRVEVFSQELDHALVWAYDLPAVSDDVPFHGNLYLEDTASRDLRTISISHEEDLKLFDFLNTLFAGVSADARHIAFESSTRMLPEAPTGVPSVYQWDDGELHLASVLPEGSDPPGGATAAPGYALDKNTGARYAMASDASALAFGAAGQLYLRIDNERTAWISEPENSSFSGEPQGVFFEGMTPDADHVLFVTDSPLLPADTNSGPDLYRWTDGPEPEDEQNLALITDDAVAFSDPANFGGPLIGMSNDARRVYIHTLNGAIEVWEEGSGRRTIDPSTRRSSIPRETTSLLSALPGKARVSPDGNWVAYILPEEIQDSGLGVIRLYDRRRDHLTTIAVNATVAPVVTRTGTPRSLPGFRPRFLSHDGEVFFSSPDALVPEDTNGVADVYSYDGPTGRLRLLTSGRGADPMMFADAGADGDNVFFLTRQPLVPSDRDDLVDLYDARAGGGFAEVEASTGAPCTGEGCQGPSTPPPPATAPASSTLRGAGNLSQERCRAKKKRSKQGRGRRCAQKHGTRRRHAAKKRGVDR